MADIAPFKGLRYNLKKIASLSKVVAPPYDVINDEQHAKLLKRDEHNVVRLILPADEPPDDRYSAAGKTLRRWIDEGVLVEEESPAIYVVSQEWTSLGARHVRTGFIAAIRLERFGEGKIFPHENTLSAPKEDRLKLLKATRANLSQIFGIFPDDRRTVDAWLRQVTSKAPLAEATDDAGVVTKFWRECTPAAVEELKKLMAERAIFIADGHHRYETAMTYQQFLAQNRTKMEPNAPESAVMMFCVAMNNNGLITLPTHRLLPRSAADPEKLLEKLKEQFSVHPNATLLGDKGEVDALLKSDRTPNLVVLYVGKGRPPMLVTPRDNSKILADFPDRSEAWKALDVSILQYAVLERLLGLTLAHVTREAKIGYEHDSDEAIRRVDSGEFASAFILRPTPVTAVASVAAHLEKMPPKSTFFYPKALTGLVIRRLW